MDFETEQGPSTEAQIAEADSKDWSRSGGCWKKDHTWNGTAVMYAACGPNSTARVGDFEVTNRTESHSEDIRLSRLTRPFTVAPKDLPASKLNRELVVIVGPEMSPAEVIHTLKSLAARIEAEGLAIGFEYDDRLVRETTDQFPLYLVDEPIEGRADPKD